MNRVRYYRRKHNGLVEETVVICSQPGPDVLGDYKRRAKRKFTTVREANHHMIARGGTRKRLWNVITTPLASRVTANC